jgi:hypothetical protein
MLKSQPDCRPGTTRRASANRVHDHHQGTALGKKPVNVRGSPSFFDAVPGQIGPHWGDELFLICHNLILPATLRRD